MMPIYNFCDAEGKINLDGYIIQSVSNDFIVDGNIIQLGPLCKIIYNNKKN